jgi:TetR/AcrR family transcriptional repressor of mexJK operon
MNAPAQVIKQGRKWDQVLDGARTVFLRDGFEGASVDDIVREAGVSKATLYSYFPDKRLLFIEVAKTECRSQSDAAIAQIEASGDVRQALTQAARRMVRFFMSDVGMQVYRIVVAESQRFPEIGQDFYNSGPALVRQMLAQFLSKAVSDGKLRIDDIDLAADQFPELCKAGLHIQMVLGLRTSVTDEEIDRVIDGAVDMFMCRYGVGD